jgi:hypothetical protein
MTAGYSGTPLVKKLGIKPGAVVAVINDPGHFGELVDPLPEAVTLRHSGRGTADVAVLFTKRRAELARRIDSLGRMIFPDAMLWICWPKKASKVATDMTEDVVRAVVLPVGLVDVKVCAVDATWSGLKVVWRKELR